MFEPSYSFSTKTTQGNSYIYVQRAIYKQNKRHVQSFSLGKLSELDKIISTAMETSESLFLGEILLYAFTQHLSQNKIFEKIVLRNKITKTNQIWLNWLINTRVLKTFSKCKLSRYYTHSAFKLLTPHPSSNDIYQLMDSIDTSDGIFEQYAQSFYNKLNYKPNWTYYDTTTIFFYSDFDDLRRKAYAKDGKKGLPNIKLSLSCTEDYAPLTFKIFPGNSADITCFKDFLTRIKDDPNFKNKIISFDSGCYSKEIIQQLEDEEYQYVCNADISKYTLEGTSQKTTIGESVWIIQPGIYEGRRIIEAFNEENYKKSIAKLDNKVKKIKDYSKEVTGRDIESKRDKIQILINGLGLKSIINVEIIDANIVLSKNKEKLKKRKQTLRKLVIMSNLPSDTPIPNLLQYYLGRSDVERVYRYLKTPLEIRPVYHWAHPRIYAHFFLVMTGYLHLTALRLFLKQKYGLTFTLDQIIEDLSFSSITSIEPKKNCRINYLGNQDTWIKQLALDFDLNLKSSLHSLTP